MPGSSLWLVPPPSHPLGQILAKLIEDALPANFPNEAGPSFAPHMTLTSNIPPPTYGNSPQEWLDSIPWPSQQEVKVIFESVKSEDVFFRRCYIKVAFEGVRAIAGLARARGVNGEETIGSATEEWLQDWKVEFGPHVSLI
jgi:2',3'-cyclic-nucleotide 3'-phosphodiesterase